MSATTAVARESEFQVVAIERLIESKTNPRRAFAKDALSDLTKSVAEKGVLVPLLVRPTGFVGEEGRHFEILAGARRFRASKEAGLKTVPVLVRDLDDTQALEVQVIENLQRQDVHPLEEAEGYKALLEKGKYGIDTLAAKVGKSASYVYQRLKLAELSDDAKKLFQEGKMTAGHAILLARLQPNDQKKAVKANGPGDWRKEFVSVRDLADWIKNNVHLVLSKAAFPLDDSQRSHGGIKSSALVPGARACVDCPKRTGANPQLFSDVDGKDTCTDPACFHAKEKTFVKIELEMFSNAKMLSAGDFYGSGKPKGLTHWTPVKNECKHTVSGVVVEIANYYHGDEKLGQYHPRVCTNQTCAVHNKQKRVGHSSGYQVIRETAQQKAKRQADDLKRELEDKADQKALGLLMDKMKQPTRRELELLAAQAYMGASSDLVNQRFGWKGGLSYVGAPKAIAKLSDLQLGQLLIAMAYDGDSYYAGDFAARKVFADQCAKNKIDRKSLVKELAEAEKSQTPTKAKPAKKAKAA